MSFETDKQTLEDLNILGKFKNNINQVSEVILK